ncbi:phage integrase central domain-containing protein [Ancylobacter sp. 3268]|uniref:phage integrase central domain-containing protein n=1 Tax=Ancylobacter sp. 3268 TaxID=2817752 RepID=UPI003857BC8B
MDERPIGRTETPDILNVFSPIWLAKTETAKRVRQRVGTVLGWAAVDGEPRARRGKGACASKHTKSSITKLCRIPRFDLRCAGAVRACADPLAGDRWPCRRQAP